MVRERSTVKMGFEQNCEGARELPMGHTGRKAVQAENSHLLVSVRGAWRDCGIARPLSLGQMEQVIANEVTEV